MLSFINRSRGFGFITFATDEQVDACQQARPHTVDGIAVSNDENVTLRKDTFALSDYYYIKFINCIVVSR